MSHSQDPSRKPPLIAILLLGIAVGLMALPRTFRQDSTQTSASRTATPEVLWFGSSSSSDGPLLTPIQLTHFSNFVYEISIDSVDDPLFNTLSGGPPSLDPREFNDTYDPIWEYQQTNSDIDSPSAMGTLEALREERVRNGGLISGWGISRMVSARVIKPHKSMTPTQNIVFWLPGGKIRDTDSFTTTVEFEEELHGFDHILLEGELAYGFFIDLWDWQIEYMDAYPMIKRCVNRAVALERTMGESAACVLLTAAVRIEEGVGTSIQLEDIAVEDLVQGIADGVATEPALSHTDFVPKANWPIPTLTPSR